MNVVNIRFHRSRFAPFSISIRLVVVTLKLNSGIRNGIDQCRPSAFKTKINDENDKYESI